MSGPTASPRTLTSAELDALPVGAAVRCTTERGLRVVVALKVGVPQGSGGHIWRTTEYSTVPGSFAIAQAGAVLLEPVQPGLPTAGDQVAPATLTSTDQSSDVVHARDTANVGNGRHEASRDIPSSAAGPAMTPAMDRAAEEVKSLWLHEEVETVARAAVSAALHDPDDPDALQRVIDRAIVQHHKDLRSTRAERVYRGEKAIEAAIVGFLIGSATS